MCKCWLYGFFYKNVDQSISLSYIVLSSKKDIPFKLSYYSSVISIHHITCRVGYNDFNNLVVLTR